MKKAVYYFIIFVIYLVVALFLVKTVMTLMNVPEDDSSRFWLQIISSGLSSVATLITFFWAKWCPVSRDYLRSKPVSVLIWASIAALGSIVPSLWLQEMIPDKFTQDASAGMLDMLLRKPEGYFIVGLLSPVVEEVVFRGAILRKLLEWGKRNGTETKGTVWAAIAISALFFAISHMNPAQIPHAFVIGLLLGWMYYRTGSIIPGLAFHWVNNAAAFVIAGMFPLIPADAKLAVYFGGDETAVLKAVGFSLLLFLPSIWQLNLLMKKASSRA